MTNNSNENQVDYIKKIKIMSKISKFNEFINNDELLIYQLIEDAESVPFSDLEAIANRAQYKKVVDIGERAVPLLLKRNLIIWSKALSEITGITLDTTVYSTSERKEFWKNWATENGFWY